MDYTVSGIVKLFAVKTEKICCSFPTLVYGTRRAYIPYPTKHKTQKTNNDGK